MKRQGQSRAGLAAFLSLATFTSIWARVLPATLSDLTALSEVIVVGTVKSVSPDSSGELVAVIAVDKVWRGHPNSTLSVSVQRTSACDMSGAIAGERAIFFLTKEADGRWHIAHAGYGHMRIVGQEVTVSRMVLLPGDPVRTSFETRKVPLSVIAFHVEASVKQVSR